MRGYTSISNAYFALHLPNIIENPCYTIKGVEINNT